MRGSEPRAGTRNTRKWARNTNTRVKAKVQSWESFLAEDLQHKSLSGSVSDNRSQYQKATDDNGYRLPESSQKKAKKDEQKA